jgi:DNA-binding response OmpR family regulator
LKLPIALANSIEDFALTATDLAPRRLGGGRVLVVENGEDSAICLTAMLRMNGFDARSARTGSEALKILSEHKPGAVIIDLDLPDMDACDIIRRVKSKSNPMVAAVVVTAHSDTGHRLAALNAGAAAYILKPAEPIELIQLLRDLCPASE